MLETEPVLIFTSRFDALGVRYMITGSVAAAIYGEPRLTNDVDMVAAISDSQTAALAGAFPSSDFYLPPEEILRTEAARAIRGHFNIIHVATGYKADVYLAGRESLHEWGLANVRRIQFEDRTIRVAPPEYVIVRKLEFYHEGKSEKHLRDIRAIIEGVSPALDIARIEGFASERGLTEIWKSVSS